VSSVRFPIISVVSATVVPLTALGTMPLRILVLIQYVALICYYSGLVSLKNRITDKFSGSAVLRRAEMSSGIAMTSLKPSESQGTVGSSSTAGAYSQLASSELEADLGGSEYV
jgi:hypothetical protein